MRFTRVAGENFRLFSRFAIQPAPTVNLIVGANASGKTTLLEALYVLGRGRSFRSAAPELAGVGGPHWRVQGTVASAGAPERTLGVGWSREGLDVNVDHGPSGIQDLVRHAAVEVLEPDSHRLLDEGPVYRRRYLDWGVFHVEHRFFPAWRRYQRALKQRNQALRDSAPLAEIEAWNPELVGAGEEVQAYREAQVESLRTPLAQQVAALLPGLEASMELSRGWSAGRSLDEALREHLEHDRRQGKTVAGPHRAELKLRLAGRSAKHQISRGQQKLLIAALLLAQAWLIADRRGVRPALLIDDFPAELGAPFQAALLSALRAYGGQVFVTAIEATAALQTVPADAMFHVEHGVVSATSRV